VIVAPLGAMEPPRAQQRLPIVQWARFTAWLHHAVASHMTCGDLMSAEELTVYSPCRRSRASNRLENIGDAWLTCSTDGIATLRQVLLMLPGVGSVDSNLCCQAAHYFCGNQAMGPYCALALGLHSLYSFSSGLTLKNEVWAGLFEQMLGALERSGLKLLLKHCLVWCVGSLLLMWQFDDCGRFWRETGYLTLGNADLERSIAGFSQLHRSDCSGPLLRCLECAGDNIISVVASLIHSCIREAGGAGSEAASGQILPTAAFSGASARTTQMHTIDQAVVCFYYMDAYCYEHGCQAHFSTGAHPWEGDVFAEL